jgi:16S rRNA C967 or C1407 C5-methylase (RsmB/RsmF family)/NOL1/NOP2/fmu family ribosome biogenesis protein
LQLPISLLNKLENVKGFNRAAFEAVHAAGESLTSVRLNTRKLLKPTDLLFPLAGKVLWSTDGYYLSERPSFTFDPLFHAGLYYVQEASSMFLEQALKQVINLSASLKVLDLCAAPGGKSALIQSLISKESLLVSNEVIKARASVLEENMVKWGAENVVITNNDPSHFGRLTNYFDVIVIDAPCSGSGLFRRDADAIQHWSENAVQLCSQRQQRIIADAWPALKQNGFLIYSTCSYSKEENEDILNWLIKEDKAEIKNLSLDNNWGIIESDGGYRFYPYKLKGEGFFITVVQKMEETIGEFIKPRKTKQEKITKQETLLMEPWLRSGKNIEMFKQGDMVLALPQSVFTELPVLQAALYIKKAGVIIGKPVAKDIVPHHELSMSDLKNTSIATVELSYEEAIRYLRRDELSFSQVAKGWALATYKHYALGWMKVLPNRVNNYYPASWRILNAAP